MGRAGVRQGAVGRRRFAALELSMTMASRALLLPTLVLMTIGCATLPNSRSFPANARDAEGYVELSAYLPRVERAERRYARTNPSRRNESPVPYVQSEDERGRVEGSLVGRVEWPLSKYLDRHSDRPERPRMKWPSPTRQGSEAFFVEFDPPVVEWPEGVQAGVPVEWQVEMSAYDRRGVPFAQGSATRRVVWEGHDTVEIDKVTYPDCLRLRVETSLSFGWWASMRLRETVWLARHIGVVRRIEGLSGYALLFFRFDSTYEYALRTHEADASSEKTATEPRRRWARLAIYLDRSVPRPRVGGLAVEWAK